MSSLLTQTDFLTWQQQLLEKRNQQKPCVYVCDGTGCRALGSQKVLARLREEVNKAEADVEIDIVGTGCPGYCEFGPLLTIFPEGISYQKVKLEDVAQIVQETLIGHQLIDRLLYEDPVTGERIRLEEDLPFYKKQNRRLLSMNGQSDPSDIEDYVRQGGYSGLYKAMQTLTPDEIIAEVRTSGLRGRGGAGFLTATKWSLCRKFAQQRGDGFVICNADEGDPGAFMDRSIIEGNPHSVIEGMIIGAYAMGVQKGYVYIRSEYPLAIENLTAAMDQASNIGLLGKNIFGSGYDFELSIRIGAGAFVCGEETALIASIEGRTGEPRPRPPYPSESGLWGKPTNINNVETWANIPYIIRNGGEAYARVGTETSKGTKIFSVVGKIKNTGLVEVPMGITLREIVFDIGGGIPGGKKFKAAQLGGPSGGCIPAEHLDVEIDYESLKKLGAIMGSGGMVIADEDTCMVDFARYFMTFTQEESCGKCVPCRVGTKAMLETLERICEGNGKPEDIDYLIELGEHVKKASLCGLGQSAPNPVLTTIRYFRDEYEAHINEKRCPAKVCKALITYSIDARKCTGCSACLRACPVDAISGSPKNVHNIDPDTCIRCGMCMSVCHFAAVEVH